MKILKYACLAFVVLFAISACNKKDYYKDYGIHDAKFAGTVLQYLRSKPEVFSKTDSVIIYAGMENIFSDSMITFFAPNNMTIDNLILSYNAAQRNEGKDTVQFLSQVKPEVWKGLLSLYVFQGARKLSDYQQIDFSLLQSFPGQTFTSYGGRPMQIGVIYDNAISTGAKYAGYRHLIIAYIQNLSAPIDRNQWIPADISSSDIQPVNGVVHILRWSTNGITGAPHYFGFDRVLFGLLVNN